MNKSFKKLKVYIPPYFSEQSDGTLKDIYGTIWAYSGKTIDPSQQIENEDGNVVVISDLAGHEFVCTNPTPAGFINLKDK